MGRAEVKEQSDADSRHLAVMHERYGEEELYVAGVSGLRPSTSALVSFGLQGFLLELVLNGEIPG